MKWMLGALALLATGCDAIGKNADEASCTIEGLSGVASATMEGDQWSASDGTWNRTGPGVQIILQFPETERSVTIRGNRDESGVDLVDKIDAGEFPINISLGGEDGTGSVLDSRFNTSYASNKPGGSGNMSILDVQGTVMSACFSFVAATDDGERIEVIEGMAEVDEL